MKRILTCFVFIVGTAVLASERPEIKPPAKYTARFLEYQDKVQDFQLELVTARMNISNAKIELAQLKVECTHIRSLVRRGFEHSVMLTACETNITNSETLLTQLESTAKTSERNRDIWTIRLAGETGETDLHGLAEKYAHKWKVALELIKAQVANAQLRVVRAREYYDHQARVYKKGYITAHEYDRAVNMTVVSHNELEAFQARQKEIEASLLETDAALTLIH